MNRKVVTTGVFHTAQVQNLGTAGGQFEHLFVGNCHKFARSWYHAGIGGVNAINICINFADIGVKRRS